jgi:LmbE family N-acetylglucosaminyl deacetylase
MADRDLTFMAVHAHPDDEATGTGGVLARYAAEGIRTVLVTCTDGGCGDGPEGVKPGEPGHDVAQVVALRRTELEASCAILNVTHLEMLGYRDSGMEGWPQNTAPGSFWSTPVEEAAARLSELIRKYRPDVIVTYDENGFYGHPDHVQTHRITMAAVAATPIARKVYWTTMPHSAMEKLGATMRELGADWDEPAPDPVGAENGDAGAQAAAAGPPIGLPDDEISTWVDIRSFGQAKFDALAEHASQSDSTFFIQLGAEKFVELLGVETFSRIQDSTGAPLPEDDLFAGLRGSE